MLENKYIDYSDKKLIKVLKKIYDYKVYEKQNYYTDESKDILVYKLPEELSEKEKTIFESSGYLLNDIKHFNHNRDINNIIKLVDSESLKPLVHQLFLKAVGEGYHRGLQSIISFYFACNVPEHVYEPYDYSPEKYFYEENKVPCRICGLTKEKYVNSSKTLYDLSIGHCRLEATYEYMTDLDEIKNIFNLDYDERNLHTLASLLKAIEDAPKDETPSELEKRISKLKILPSSNLTARTWLLHFLSIEHKLIFETY